MARRSAVSGRIGSIFSCSKTSKADGDEEKAPTPMAPTRVAFVNKEDVAKVVKPPAPKLDKNCYCSITQEIMADPVLAMDGFTYERAAITEWFKNHDTSPQTNLKVPSKTLIPNNAIKSMIASYKDAKMRAVPPKASTPPTEDEEKSSSAPSSGVADTYPEPEEIDINVNASVDKHGLVKISVLADEDGVVKCPPADVVLIMDRSGSMAAKCVGVDENSGVCQENGFTVLDLVKHAMKTCVNALRSCDRCALIIFDNEIVRTFNFTAMNEAGRKMAVSKIGAVKERGSTNIYGAVMEGIKIIEARTDKTRNPSMLFFTDGLPNCNPARGEREAFKKVLRQKKGTVAPVHTFGFGIWRNIDSSLLYDMAQIFNGFNGYVQDATFLGTTFVNAISNVLTTAAVDVKFHLTGKEVWKLIPHVGDFPFEVEGEGDKSTLTVNLGTVRFGQSVDFVLEFPTKMTGKFPKYKVTYSTGGKAFQTKPKRTLTRGPTAKGDMMRFKTIKMLKQVIADYRVDMTKARNEVKSHIKALETAALTDKVSQGILQNTKAQNTRMLDKEKYMNKWGKHQCRMYVRSLNLQIKNNFKDPGVQHFGGKLFLDISDEVDDIFNNMPPPKPSAATATTTVITSSQNFSRAYNNPQNDYINGHGHTGGGCFSGNGNVHMADGSFKLVREVRPGDVLATPGGPRQVALVRKDELQHAGCFVNGLWITPKHPVRVHGSWFNPSDLWEASEACPNTTWFNIELHGGNSFFINGIELVALGHDNVIPRTDPAYSTEKDAQYGRGWRTNPARLNYLPKTLLPVLKPIVSTDRVGAPLAEPIAVAC